MAVLESLELNLSADKARSVVGMVAENWRAALNARQSFDQKVAAYWARYEAVAPVRELPFKQASNLRIPLTQWVIDSVWVRQMRTIYGQKPYLQVWDNNLQQPPESSDLERVIQHLAEVDLHFRSTGGHLLLNSLVEGTGIGKLVRSEQKRTVRDRYGAELLERTITDFQGLGLEVIDLKDFVVANPAEYSIDRQPWLAHRVWLRWDEIARRQRDGVYKFTRDQMTALKNLGKRGRNVGGMALDQTKANLDQTEQVGWGTFDEWEFVESIYRYDWDGDGFEEECLLTVCVDYPDIPARAEAYPFWNGKRNYIAYRPLPRVNRFYGRSLAGIMQPLQDEADAEVNQSLDASTFTILANLTPILSRSMKREWETHKWVLGKPIYVDSPELFRSLADLIKHPIQLSQFQLSQILQMAERAGGVSDPQLGKPAQGSKTAFEIATVQAEGNIRFAEMIEQQQLSNQELGFQVIEHAYQLSLESEEFRQRLFRVVGRDPFENVSMEDIRKRLAVVPTGNTITSNKELEAKKWLGVWQLFKDDPMVQMDLSYRHFLATKVLRALGAEQEAEQIVGTKEGIQKAKQLIAQRAQQVQAAAASGQMPGMGLLPPGGSPGGGPGGPAVTESLPEEMF